MYPIQFQKCNIGGTTVAKVHKSGRVTFEDRFPNGLGKGSSENDFWTHTIRKKMEETGREADVIAIEELTKVGFNMKEF